MGLQVCACACAREARHRAGLYQLDRRYVHANPVWPCVEKGSLGAWWLLSPVFTTRFWSLVVAAIMADQTERAYQRQEPIFENKKRLVGARKSGRKELRYVRNPGLGFKVPREVSWLSHG